MTRLDTRVLRSFDDPALSSQLWQHLLATGPSNVVFLTLEWQRAWWASFGRGDLLLTLVEREGEPVALAPWFADGGMLFLVGSGGSDQLDLLGDVRDPEVVAAAVRAAADQVPDFLGTRLYHLPSWSSTLDVLHEAAERADLEVVPEGELQVPVLGLDGDNAQAAADRKSLRRHTRWFEREGALVVRHLRRSDDVEPYLEPFFDQHIRRWEGTGSPSLFCDTVQRDFYGRLVAEGGPAGWLRFTAVEWDGALVAAHFGSHHGGRYLWYKPSFDIDLARRSPGEVLLRHLFLAAADEGAEVFDFGIGDESFKHRFASEISAVRTVGLYPPGVAP